MDNFDGYAQPEWNEDGAVALALQRLKDAHDASSSHEAYDQFLWVVGNNHAGTYYPVLLETLSALRELIAGGGPWSQRAVMECLIDLGGSFVPEFEPQDGVDTRAALAAWISELRPLLLPLIARNDVTSASAAELVELIDDQVS